MASNLRSRKGRSHGQTKETSQVVIEEDSSVPPNNNNSQSPSSPSSSNNNNTQQQNDNDKVKCAICLGDLVNKSYSNKCRHQFCFGCLVEWSKVKPECPLCKVIFNAIYHNFGSDAREFDTYQVPELVNNTLAHHIHLPFVHHLEGDLMTVGLSTHRFSANRYHPYGPPSGSSSFYPREHFRILEYVPLERRHNYRNPFRTGQTEYFGTSINLHNNEASSSSGITNYQARRRIYDRDQYVIPFSSSLQSSSNLHASDEYLRTHSSAMARISPWLHREITVLLGLRLSNEMMASVYDTIMSVLHNYDIRSRDFRELVHSFFGSSTRHFQHELYHFVLSGMSLEEYDRTAEYPPVNEATSYSSSGPITSAGPPVVPPVVTIDDDSDNDDDSVTAIQSTSPGSSAQPAGPSSMNNDFGSLRHIASTSSANLPWDLTTRPNDLSRPLTQDDFPALRISDPRRRCRRSDRADFPADVNETAYEAIISRIAAGDIEEFHPHTIQLDQYGGSSSSSSSTTIQIPESGNGRVGSSSSSSSSRRRRGDIELLEIRHHELQIEIEHVRRQRARLEQQSLENMHQQLLNTWRHSSSFNNNNNRSSSSNQQQQQEEVPVPVVDSDNEGDDCVLLGVQPVVKKPPLAVITISSSSSSSSEEEEEGGGGDGDGTETNKRKKIRKRKKENQNSNNNDSGSSGSNAQQFKNEVEYSHDIVHITNPFQAFLQCPLPSNSVTVSTSGTAENFDLQAALPCHHHHHHDEVNRSSSSKRTRSIARTRSNSSIIDVGDVDDNNEAGTSRSTRKRKAENHSSSSKKVVQEKNVEKHGNSKKRSTSKLHSSSRSSILSILKRNGSDETDKKTKQKSSKSKSLSFSGHKKFKRITILSSSSSSSEEDTDSSIPTLLSTSSSSSSTSSSTSAQRRTSSSTSSDSDFVVYEPKKGRERKNVRDTSNKTNSSRSKSKSNDNKSSSSHRKERASSSRDKSSSSSKKASSSSRSKSKSNHSNSKSPSSSSNKDHNTTTSSTRRTKSTLLPIDSETEDHETNQDNNNMMNDWDMERGQENSTENSTPSTSATSSHLHSFVFDSPCSNGGQPSAQFGNNSIDNFAQSQSTLNMELQSDLGDLYRPFELDSDHDSRSNSDYKNIFNSSLSSSSSDNQVSLLSSPTSDHNHNLPSGVPIRHEMDPASAFLLDLSSIGMRMDENLWS